MLHSAILPLTRVSFTRRESTLNHCYFTVTLRSRICTALQCSTSLALPFENMTWGSLAAPSPGVKKEQG